MAHAYNAAPPPSIRVTPPGRAHHQLGPRPLFELIFELANGAEVPPRLEAYADLAPLADFIAELGGDRLPPAVRLVRGQK